MLGGDRTQTVPPTPHYLNPTILGSRHSTCLQLKQLLLLTTCVNNVGSNCFDEPLSIARHPSSDFAIVFLLPSTQFPSSSFLERESGAYNFARSNLPTHFTPSTTNRPSAASTTRRHRHHHPTTIPHHTHTSHRHPHDELSSARPRWPRPYPGTPRPTRSCSSWRS